jgi:hypothetical protein
MDDREEIKPDKVTLGLYQEATPFVLGLFEDPNSETLIDRIRDINKKIYEHNVRLGLKEDSVDEILCIYCDEIKDLVKEAYDHPERRARVIKDQKELNTERSYPVEWVLPEQAISERAHPSHSLAGSNGSSSLTPPGSSNATPELPTAPRSNGSSSLTPPGSSNATPELPTAPRSNGSSSLSPPGISNATPEPPPASSSDGTSEPPLASNSTDRSSPPSTSNITDRSSQSPGSLSGMDLVRGHAPQISTDINIKVQPGRTPYGGYILRYMAYFQNTGKPKYRFVVREDTDLGPNLVFKSGKEIGETAMAAYLANPNKMKLTEFYGEKKYGIKYTVEFFRLYCVSYLSGLRTQAQTKTGRLMPVEYAVLGFNKDGTEWWDIFTRSAFRAYKGTDADRRCDEWWEEHNQDVSTRKSLVQLSAERSNGSSLSSQASRSSPGSAESFTRGSSARSDVYRLSHGRTYPFTRASSVESSATGSINCGTQTTENTNGEIVDLRRQMIEMSHKVNILESKIDNLVRMMTQLTPVDRDNAT